jgi:hypothetical protein
LVFRESVVKLKRCTVRSGDWSPERLDRVNLAELF